MSDYRHIMTGPKRACVTGWPRGIRQGKFGTAYREELEVPMKKTVLPSCTENYRDKAGVCFPNWHHGPGTFAGIPPWAWGTRLGPFGPVRQGSGMNLADCPDHAEGPDSQGPTQGIGASLVPSPWHNAVRREKFREAVHRGGGRPPDMCTGVSCCSPGAWPPARSDRRTDGSRRGRFQVSGNRC